MLCPSFRPGRWLRVGDAFFPLRCRNGGRGCTAIATATGSAHLSPADNAPGCYPSCASLRGVANCTRTRATPAAAAAAGEPLRQATESGIFGSSRSTTGIAGDSSRRLRQCKCPGPPEGATLGEELCSTMERLLQQRQARPAEDALELKEWETLWLSCMRLLRRLLLRQRELLELQRPGKGPSQQRQVMCGAVLARMLRLLVKSGRPVHSPGMLNAARAALTAFPPPPASCCTVADLVRGCRALQSLGAGLRHEQLLKAACDCLLEHCRRSDIQCGDSTHQNSQAMRPKHLADTVQVILSPVQQQQLTVDPTAVEWLVDAVGVLRLPHAVRVSKAQRRAVQRLLLADRSSREALFLVKTSGSTEVTLCGSQAHLEFALGPYVLDVAFPEEKVGIEIDGESHCFLRSKSELQDLKFSNGTAHQIHRCTPKTLLKQRVLLQHGWVLLQLQKQHWKQTQLEHILPLLRQVLTMRQAQKQMRTQQQRATVATDAVEAGSPSCSKAARTD
ncbi:rap domain-containing protein [Cyclospora cayetanensis]|uniref:Rap domain-containing protein n=1 Tax=Cyclospora cayetanensis TaxID=88456 RepID=A0A1D3CT53_9EIME|nr:rap domain-containing protein [Cyclospora cayetanensis]